MKMISYVLRARTEVHACSAYVCVCGLCCSCTHRVDHHGRADMYESACIYICTQSLYRKLVHVLFISVGMGHHGTWRSVRARMMSLQTRLHVRICVGVGQMKMHACVCVGVWSLRLVCAHTCESPSMRANSPRARSPERASVCDSAFEGGSVTLHAYLRSRFSRTVLRQGL